MLTMISYLYKSDMSIRVETNRGGRRISSNVPPVTEIGDYIYDETTSICVSIIK